MEVAICTVGDELLAGDTTNTNARWLADHLTDRGVTVTRILTVPDDLELISDSITRLRVDADALIVTGGIGGTPDDRTMTAVGVAMERDLVVHDQARDHIHSKLKQLRDTRPSLFESHDLTLDIETAASIPEGADPILVDEAWAPGCVLEDVYVFAGIPTEMKAMFKSVKNDFTGDRISRTIKTPAPEGVLRETLSTAEIELPVTIGSYPRKDDRPGRITVTGTDIENVEAAVQWLCERIETVDS